MKMNIMVAAWLTALLSAGEVSAQFNLGSAVTAAAEGIQALSVSDAEMAAYAHQSVEQMDAQNKVAAPDSPYTRRLNQVTAGLVDVNGTPLNFKVYITKDVNAFACPDGSVRVYSGLMDIMNDDELLGVIGHEIGHVAKKHSKKAFKQKLLTCALVDGVASAGGTAAAISQSDLVKLGEVFSSATYSKKQESQADDYGYDFLKKHGKNPWGMVTAFQKLENMEQRSGSEPSALQLMFSDHPDTAARIQRMAKRCRKDRIAPPSGTNTSSPSSVPVQKSESSLPFTLTPAQLPKKSDSY